MRVGFIQEGKGSKSSRIKDYIDKKIGLFSKDDIRQACPDISESAINCVLNELKGQGIVEPTGLGRDARWRKKE